MRVKNTTFWSKNGVKNGLFWGQKWVKKRDQKWPKFDPKNEPFLSSKLSHFHLRTAENGLQKWAIFGPKMGSKMGPKMTPFLAKMAIFGPKNKWFWPKIAYMGQCPGQNLLKKGSKTPILGVFRPLPGEPHKSPYNTLYTVPRAQIPLFWAIWGLGHGSGPWASTVQGWTMAGPWLGQYMYMAGPVHVHGWPPTMYMAGGHVHQPCTWLMDQWLVDRWSTSHVHDWWTNGWWTVVPPAQHGHP